MSSIRNPEKVTILATGGTIDKFYSVAGTLDIGAPAAQDLLDRVITDIKFEIRPLIGKDSLDMTDADRAELAAALNAVRDERNRPLPCGACGCAAENRGAHRGYAASRYGAFGRRV